MTALRAVITVMAVLAGVTACQHAGCPKPERLPGGTYSSYRTAGTMPSGSSVTLSDGDTYSCANGIVTVR
jgi:hypothetical protein